MYRNEPGVYDLYKADTGALRFKVRYPMGMGFAAFTLTSKTDTKTDLYQVFFGPTYRFVDSSSDGQQESRRFNLSEPIGTEFREFWMTWYSNVIRLGIGGRAEPIMTYECFDIVAKNIGFVKFYLKSVRWAVDWIFEASPVILKPLKDINFEEGHLHWTVLAENCANLPEDALVAGFENEPIYITRSNHNGSLCPGKYVPSKRCGYVPWGGREHPKQQQNQILCGFNVKWIKTHGNYIPENAFVAGYSEVRQEPLYIGRALFDNQLLVGKVHSLYSTCYLPYKGKEIEVGEFETLVTTDASPRGILTRTNVFERNLPRLIVL